MFIESTFEQGHKTQLTSEIENNGLLGLSLKMDELLAKFDSLKAKAAEPIERKAKIKQPPTDGNQLTQAGMMLIDW